MSTKNSRSGGKYGGGHTTMTPVAIKICDQIIKSDLITKICPGYIKSGIKSSGGKTRIKVKIEEGRILASVRGNINHQEIYIYGSDLGGIRDIIYADAKKSGFLLS